TSEKHLVEILETKILMVSQWERRNNVKPPSLWLSTNPIWENSATKAIKQNGQTRIMTKDEQHHIIGLIRFVLEFDKYKLCTWARYKYLSNTPQKLYSEMEKSGIAKGADPNEWYASFTDIPLNECIACEKWNGERWESHSDLKNL